MLFVCCDRIQVRVLDCVVLGCLIVGACTRSHDVSGLPAALHAGAAAETGRPAVTAGATAVVNAGASGSGTRAGASGNATSAGAATVTYPPLQAAAIGSPARISNAFTLAESPTWDPCGHKLLFTDVTASVILQLGADNQISMFIANTNNANGLAYDIDGSLILAQMGGNPGHVARRDKTGAVHTIDPPGSMLHTPDDVVVRSDGTIYFSDGEFPPIGQLNLGQLPVYTLPPNASKLVNGGSVTGPNGVELSPDEKTLYVDATFENSVWAFAVAPDGTLTKSRAPLATGLLGADSLCLDAAGNLYIGVSTGLQVLRPDGSKVTLIPINSTQGVTNCTFGGDDGRTLYITAWTSLWKVDDMPIPGLDWVVNQERVHCQ